MSVITLITLKIDEKVSFVVILKRYSSAILKNGAAKLDLEETKLKTVLH